MRHSASSSLLRLAAPCALFVFLGASQGGCQLLAGLGGEETLAATGGTGGGTGGSGATGGSGGTTGSTTDTGGSGGTGLTGPCSPKEQQACYTGPEGTEDVGACKSGNAQCTDEGVWGACVGQVLPQPESCASTADENCDSYDCTVWVKVLDGEVYGESIAVDAQGHVIVAVGFYSSANFGDGVVVPVGQSDLAVLKYDKSGALVWKKVFPVPGQQYARAIAVDAAGNIAVGGESDAAADYGTGMQPTGTFVLKLDPAGTLQWARTGVLVGSGFPPFTTHVALDADGNVFAGGSGSGVDFGPGHSLTSGDQTNFFVIKLAAATGQPVWSKITKGGKNETLAGLKVDPSGSPVLTGTWNSTYMGLASATQSAPNDHYNCCGQDAPFLLRIDPNGTASEAKMLAGFNPINASVGGLGVDSFGAAAIVGDFYGTLDFQSGVHNAGSGTSYYVVRDNTTGFGQWSKVLVGDPKVGTGANHVAVDGSDNIVIAGQFSGPADFGGGPLSPDGGVFLLKLDKDGKHLWSRGYPFGDGGIRAIAAGKLEDETAVVGNFYGSLDFGTGLIEAQQGFFIARLGK